MSGLSPAGAAFAAKYRAGEYVQFDGRQEAIQKAIQYAI